MKVSKFQIWFMDHLERLQNQHVEIRQLIVELLSLTKKANTNKNAEEIALILGRISGRFKLNHTMESKSVYQYLMDSHDTQKMKIAKTFLSEMENLMTEFAQYRKNYRLSYDIKANMPQFKKISEIIFRKIEIRLNQEDNTLYPLVDEEKLDMKIHNAIQSTKRIGQHGTPKREIFPENEEDYQKIELTQEQLKLEQPIRISLVNSKISSNPIKKNAVNEFMEELKEIDRKDSEKTKTNK
ncbi:hypothetical protein NEF87_002036 [Candidatus Lokiarchaeum ossiferum]|uniref:Hemerythrin-like domain-containing protein n=1 Tax=Candidatus Lokiarchaeum ossiferum TaxID=2951803 RepID=A0ABY6HT77_9ARCH|nr:hypothetical protein NEF87_002036 [Candidatus Lokiarchaeum sp. B-35]